MSAVAHAVTAVSGETSIKTARVCAPGDRAGMLKVAWREGARERREAVRRVVAAHWTPTVGDEVLVIGSAGDGYYAIGPLAQGTPEEVPVLNLSGGGEARVDAAGTLEVRDAQGLLMFRYLDREGEGHLSLQAAKLDIAATAGDLSLGASGELKLSGERIRLEGRRDLAAAVRDTAGCLRSALHVDREGIALRGRQLTARADEVLGEARRAQWSGRYGEVRLQRLVTVAERLESRVGTLVETVRNAYRKVAGLSQLRARRVRQIADETLQVKARRVLYRALDSYKVRGDKIHLG